MKITKGIINRILQVNQESGLSKRKFSISLGRSPAAIQEIYMGRAKTLSQSIITMLEMRYGVNPQWLQSGKGPAKTGSYFIIKPEEVRLIEIYRNLPPEEKHMMSAMSEFIEQHSDSKKAKEENDKS